MSRILSCATLVTANLLFTLAAVPAHAQALPGGSYLQSCSNIGAFGDRLVADCRRMDGSWDRTALREVGRCVGDIANMNGRLICDYAEPAYGSEYDYNYSSATSRNYGYPRIYGLGR